MGWLSHTDDEVKKFHPAFESIASISLSVVDKSNLYEWIHHDASAEGGIPDFVLREVATKKWLLVVEVKKTRSAVTSSTQYRRQAHSYALENKNKFKYNSPLLYCLTNLEQTQLFGANDHADLAISPNARQVNGWNHGDFKTTPCKDHKLQFEKDLAELITLSINAKKPLIFLLDFPSIWSVIETAGIDAGSFLPDYWAGVPYSSWFSTLTDTKSRGLLLAVQCLLAEWIVYQSEQHGHPDKNILLHLQRKGSDVKNRNHVSEVFRRILQIDFEDILGGSSAPQEVRKMNDPTVLSALSQIVGELQNVELNQLTALVGESGLPDLLFDELQEYIYRSRRGTLQTDPELAQVAAELGLYNIPKESIVIDPCAGIGNLLTAAYHARSSLTHDCNIKSLVVIEIDPIQCALAVLQLMMQLPGVASKTNSPKVFCDSLASKTREITNADLVLLNPPYKRYENDNDPLPDGYLEQLTKSIESVKGKPAETTNGQADLYNYYVELVISSMKVGARGVFVLNNKWMNTKTTLPLRRLLVSECTVEALVQYPHNVFFKGHMIATSLLVFTKGKVKKNPPFHFLRCLDDLRNISVHDVLQAAYHGVNTEQIRVASHARSELEAHTLSDKQGAWLSFFTLPDCVSLFSELPLLVDHFDSVVQGRLERDEVAKVVSFPFRDWTKKGTSGQNTPSKSFLVGNNREAPKGGIIPEEKLKDLTEAASKIPVSHRGYAIKVAHKMGTSVGFVLDPSNFSHEYSDGSTDGILEPPDLRKGAWERGDKKARWKSNFEKSLDEMRKNPSVGPFIKIVEDDLGLKNRPENIVWEDLLRPCAGEMILLRAFRAGWRAHLNSAAFNPEGQQLRVSSNFYSFRGISVSTEERNCKDANEATRVVLAFLLSSFGQIQFELYGQNREGLRKCEKASCIERIRVPHPASFGNSIREELSLLVNDMECPIDCESHPHADPLRRQLDLLIAGHLLNKNKSDMAVIKFVDSVAEDLDEIQRERLG